MYERPSPRLPSGRVARLPASATKGLPVGSTHCRVAAYERSGAPPGSFLVKRQPALRLWRVRGLWSSIAPVPSPVVLLPVVAEPPLAVEAPPLPVTPPLAAPPLPVVVDPALVVVASVPAVVPALVPGSPVVPVPAPVPPVGPLPLPLGLAAPPPESDEQAGASNTTNVSRKER